MQPRAIPRATPPDRLPYLRVAVAGGEVWLRVPSPYGVALLTKALGQEHIAAIIRVLLSVEGGKPLVQALVISRAGVADALAVLGALIGMGWADTVLELATPNPTTWEPETVQAYGSGVLEELHEAGWSLSVVVACGLALLEQLSIGMALEEEVLERARFFLPRRAPASAAESKSSASSSAGESAASEP